MSSIWRSECHVILSMLRDRIAKHGPTDEIAADIRDLEHRAWEMFDKARDLRDREACASPDVERKCHGCGCWKSDGGGA